MAHAVIRLAHGGVVRLSWAEQLGGVLVAQRDEVSTPRGPRLDARYVISTITAGAVSLDVGESRWEATAGRVILLPPFAVCREVPATPSGWQCVSLHVCPETVRTIRRPNDYRVMELDPVFDAPAVARSIAALPAALAGDGVKTDLLVERIIELVFRAQPRRRVAIAATTQQRAVHVAREYLHGLRGSAVPSLADLVEITGLSRFHFCRVFHRATGVPPYAYYEHARFARARDLIHQGVGIAAAAFRLGYSDQSHLTRHFKRYAAMTPGQYARALRQARNM